MEKSNFEERRMIDVDTKNSNNVNSNSRYYKGNPKQTHISANGIRQGSSSKIIKSRNAFLLFILFPIYPL